MRALPPPRRSACAAAARASAARHTARDAVGPCSGHDPRARKERDMLPPPSRLATACKCSPPLPLVLTGPILTHKHQSIYTRATNKD